MCQDLRGRGEGGARNRHGWTEKDLSTSIQARKRWSPRRLLELGGLGQEVSGVLGEGGIQSQASRGGTLGLDSDQARGRLCMLPPDWPTRRRASQCLGISIQSLG